MSGRVVSAAAARIGDQAGNTKAGSATAAVNKDPRYVLLPELPHIARL